MDGTFWYAIMPAPFLERLQVETVTIFPFCIRKMVRTGMVCSWTVWTLHHCGVYHGSGGWQKLHSWSAFSSSNPCIDCAFLQGVSLWRDMSCEICNKVAFLLLLSTFLSENIWYTYLLKWSSVRLVARCVNVQSRYLPRVHTFWWDIRW